MNSVTKNHKEFIKYNKLILKSQQRFRNEKQKIALIANDDKRIQSFDSIEAYAYRTKRDIVCKKDIVCNLLSHQLDIDKEYNPCSRIQSR